MKLVINFGLNIKKEVYWYKDVMDFPKLIRFNGNKWEWSMYQSSGNGYDLIFSQVATYDPNYYVDMPSFEEMFEWDSTNKCECGAIYSSFNWDHLRYCSRWKPWSQV